MTFAFRPARRSEAKPLIGLYAESGAGKTYSALLLARGFAGDGKIGMIETEAGRGEAYSDLVQGGYDVLSLREEFSSQSYGKAIEVAEAGGLSALIIDSASHEWEGVGGVLDMAARNQEQGRKGPLVWQRPKMDHSRHFMLRLMQTPIPLVIVCMRAHYPMRENPAKKGEWQKSDELKPKQADDILHEMFVHGWIDREHRLHVTKLTRPDLSTVFVDKQPITLDTGRRLAAWARAGHTNPTAQPTHTPAADPGTQATRPVPADGAPRPNGTSHLPPDDGALSRDGWSEFEIECDNLLADSATRGMSALKSEWKAMHSVYQKKLEPRLRAIHQPTALRADKPAVAAEDRSFS